MADRHIAEPSRVDDPEVQHETSDVNIRAILGFGVALLATAIVIHFLVWLLFRYFDAREITTVREYPLAAEQQNRLPPEPRLQTDPRQDLRDMRAREEVFLTTYGWVDKNAGTVRIPIEEAMRLAVERGLPSRQDSPR
jgi:hypothetical protein